jgi:hypothetical protein
MRWLTNIIIFFSVILIYLHIFIHFKISENNEFSILDDISKEKILSNIYYKLPFVFDGTSIIKPLDLVSIKNQNKDVECYPSENFEKKKKKFKIYKKKYDPLPILEPYVRYFTNNTIYELKKGKKIDIHRNLYCRNFYMVHTGKVTIYCIHPKYKNLINDKEIEQEPDILRMELYPNSILFIPNYWYIHVVASEKSIVEIVQYKTILNEINFLYDNVIKLNLIS